jgi:phosphatidylglycerophosphate synthase
MKKIFTIGAKNNFLILIISYLAFPLSLILNSLKFSPNLVTLCSFLSCCLSCYFFLQENFILFFIYWFFGSILDFSDGQIARITGKNNKTAFNFDGISDQMKIFLLITSSAMHYNEYFYWVVATLVIFLFPFFSILNVTYVNIKNFKKKINLTRSILSKNLFVEKILRNFVSIFLKIDGHSLFLFLLLAISKSFAYYTLIYFIIVLSLNVFRFSYLLLKIRII